MATFLKLFIRKMARPISNPPKWPPKKCNFKCSYFFELKFLESIRYGQKWQNFWNFLQRKWRITARRPPNSKSPDECKRLLYIRIGCTFCWLKLDRWISTETNWHWSKSNGWKWIDEFETSPTVLKRSADKNSGGYMNYDFDWMISEWILNHFTHSK